MSFRMSTFARRLAVVTGVTLVPLLLIAAVLIVYQGDASASSHREAPLIGKDADADGTDTYVFISPENQNNIVFVGNWIPFEGPEGGPNYYEWDPSALYDIYVDNDGDAKPDITYTLSSRVEVPNLATFLYNTGPIASLTSATWNRPQFISITEKLEDGTVNVLVGNKRTAPVNIGSKSTPDYSKLESEAIYPITTPQGAGKAFAGQTDDPFWVDLQVFDLLTLRGQAAPVGYTTGTNIPVDSLSGFNVHSLVIEVPIAHVTQGTETVVGMWAGTRRPTTRVIGALNARTNSGDYVQVSRLGMPLVNEVVIPLALKDAFNSLTPSQDAVLYTYAGADPFLKTVQQLLQTSVEDPEIGRLLCTLYGVPLPGDADKNCSSSVTIGTARSGRGDIFDIFLRGFKLAKPFKIITSQGPNGTAKELELAAGTNVNQPAGVVPAEMLRINTALKGDICSPTPSRLGILGGDACGFPNGRRLGDEVVEIELAAVAGAAYQVIDGRDAAFTFDAGLLKVLNDGIDTNDVPFRKTFPYLAQAHSGQTHWHTNPFFNLLLPWIQKQ